MLELAHEHRVPKGAETKTLGNNYQAQPCMTRRACVLHQGSVRRIAIIPHCGVPCLKHRKEWRDHR